MTHKGVRSRFSTSTPKSLGTSVARFGCQHHVLIDPLIGWSSCSGIAIGTACLQVPRGSRSRRTPWRCTGWKSTATFSRSRKHPQYRRWEALFSLPRSFWRRLKLLDQGSRPTDSWLVTCGSRRGFLPNPLSVMRSAPEKGSPQGVTTWQVAAGGSPHPL